MAGLSSRLQDELVVTVNGVSKTFAMTGWRIATRRVQFIISAVFQSHATSAPAAFSQAGACEALVNVAASKVAVDAMRVEFNKRRLHLVKRLNALNGVTCIEPQGAFYCFPTYRVFGGHSTVRPLNVLWIYRGLPGPGACGRGARRGLRFSEYVRLSYATSMENIDKGLDRLEKLLG